MRAGAKDGDRQPARTCGRKPSPRMRAPGD